MDTTLEEYIASNEELQATINCVKAQINSARMGKNLLKKVSKIPEDDRESDEDVMELHLSELERELWKGPSSKKNFLSLNLEKENEDDELDQMYDKLNSGLKKININEENQFMSANEVESNDFDLRQIIGKNRSTATDLPSLTSQQWRLREPNVGHRPAGMPPLVPTSLLKQLTNAKNPKRTDRNANKRAVRAFQNRNFAHKQIRNNRFKPAQRKRPKVWDHEPHASGHENTRSRAPTPGVAALVDIAGGVQYVPFNTVVAAANSLNGNNINGLLGARSHAGSNLALNGLGYYSNWPLNYQRAAGSYNACNLHGIRGIGRIERAQPTASQNDYNLQRALQMFFNTGDGNSNDSKMNVGGISTNQTSALITAAENMLKRGIVIKLAEPGVDC